MTHDSVIHGHHDPALVFLSIAIAIFGSYTALDLAGRIKVTAGSARHVWLAASAVALGGGIWSMHFVAMLAFSIGRPIAYSVSMTLISLAAAILVVGVGLFLVSRRPAHGANLAAAGTFTGLGIATMHYTGMAAMQMDATISYEPWLFSLSIVIAVVASIVALWMSFNLENAWEKVAAGFVMGGAIAGMHFTGMQAAIFTPVTVTGTTPVTASTIPLLAAVIAVATFGILLLGLLSSTADRRLTAQAEREMERLRRDRSRFRTVLDAAHDAFIIVNEAGRITFWNAEAERTFGWYRGQVIGRLLTETIIPTRFHEAHIRGFARYLETGEGTVLDRRLELTARDASGREFPVEMTISAIRRDGHVTFNAFIRDISEREHRRHELVAAKEQAEAANRAKSVFLANMSHELRTPLNAIIGFSDLMGERLHGTLGHPAYGQYAADINRAGRHLLDLINDILDVSRADAGHLDIHEESVNIAEAIEMSISTVREAARRGGVELSVAMPADMPDLIADSRRLRQILINLLSNAVKFTPTGGSVALQVSLIANGEIAFSVSDTGIGMTAEQIDIALSPFGQVDARLSRKYEGTGLGLPLTKRLVSLHDGTLEVTSTPGVGTTAAARFPAARTRRRDVAAAD